MSSTRGPRGVTLTDNTQTIVLTEAVLSSSQSTVGLPSDGIWTDGLAAITPTMLIPDALALLNEAALGIVNGSRNFSTLVVSGSTTLAALNATTGVFSSTLNVIGSTTLGALSAGATILGALTGTNATFSGTLGVTGTTTLGAVTAGATTVSSLGVSGTITLAALSATTGTFSSTLSVTGLSTLGVLGATATTVTTLTASGAATLQSTLAVTGTSTLGNVTSTGITSSLGNGVLLTGNETINNLEATPSEVRYGLRVLPNAVATSNETTAMYLRVSPAGADAYGIYAEIDSSQTDTHGGFLKLIHFGAGDALYAALRNTGLGFEMASYYSGSRHFVGTNQRQGSGNPQTGTDFGNTVHFSSVWGDDTTGGSTTPPNYGTFYADRSLGNSFFVRVQDPARTGYALGRTEFRISNFALTRNYYELYNTGETHLKADLATVGTQNVNSPPLHLIGSTWSGGASVDQTTKAWTVVSGGVPALRIALGQFNSETLAAILSTSGLDLQGGTLACGAVTASGALSVIGASTLAAMSATTGSFSSTLTVAGTSTLGAVNAGALGASTGFFGSTLGVIGTATLGVTNTAALSATTGAFSSTLNVSGASTLAALSATTGNFSSTLVVAGTSTLGAVNAGALGATTGFFGSTLGVIGTATLGATNTAALTATTGSFSGTLGVTGATTLASLSATTGTFSSTLGVTGASTLAALSATTGTFSSTLGVTGTSTLGTTNTGAFTGTTGSFSSTLGVTGATTLAAMSATGVTSSGDVTATTGSLKGGSLVLTEATKTASYTCDSSSAHDYCICADATAGAMTITLPAVSVGRIIVVKKIDKTAFAVTVTPASGTIEGATSAVLSQPYQTACVSSDGTNWFISASSGVPASHELVGGCYFEDDLWGGGFQISAQTTGSGNAGWGLPTPGGVITVPSGWTAASLNQHPGIAFVQTGALNDVGSAIFFTTGTATFPIFSTGPAFVWTCYFAVPNALSTSGDRYRFCVGMGGLNSKTSGVNGVGYLYYSDNVNSGNWVLAEGLGAIEGCQVTIANSSVAPVAGTWNKLQIVKANNSTTITAYLNNALLCSGTGFKAADPMPANIGGCMWLIRDTFTSGVHTAFIDKVTYSQAASTRVP